MMINDNELVIKELRNIILDKPLSKQFNEHVSNQDDFNTLKQAMQYLSNSLSESNLFLQNLSRGEFDVVPPGRHNFLTGYLKELQSVLRHLTWQTGRVADGDYTQHVDNLGDFSTSFNKMVAQLEERESELKMKSKTLDSSIKLLTSIVELQENLVVITDIITKEIIYINKSAKSFFFPSRGESSTETCQLLQLLKNINHIDTTVDNCFDHYCEVLSIWFEVKTFPFEWDGRATFIHYLTDITQDSVEKQELLERTYVDELTNIYNRRFFQETIEDMLSSHATFAIALIDIDGLKFVNDQLGHIIGDEYILSVVSEINNHISQTDIFSRIGGDEFVLILPNYNQSQAADVLDTIYKKILLIEANYPLSISYGLAAVGFDNILSESELISNIDEKMYAFKGKYKKERTVAKDG